MFNKVINIFRPKPAIPTDGSAVPTGRPGEYAYLAAGDRPQASRLSLPAMADVYFKKDHPRLLRNSEALEWKYIKKIGSEYSGCIVLADSKGTSLLAIKYQGFIHPLPGGDRFLSYRYHGTAEGQNDAVLFLFHTKNLKPLSEDQVQRFLDDPSNYILFEDGKAEMERFELNEGPLVRTHIFHGEIAELDEVLMVRDLRWLVGKDKRKYTGASIISVEPKYGKITIMPQDWFNTDDRFDPEYQWITMAARDPETRNIHGFGIRLANFVVDPTGQKAIKPGESVFF